MSAFYNEREPYAAAWLRNLIEAGHIAPGIVDERDIRDISPDELMGFTQCHFFAGIGVWQHALRNAGWPDERPIWTGSCPCQPFSAAGRGAGFTDERHLWPHWQWLIKQCRPPIVLGEQVASKDGLAWLDLVSADMEGEGYTFGASDLCAAGFSGAHIRQRLYFVGLADTSMPRHDRAIEGAEGETRDQARLLLPSAVERNGRLAESEDGRRGEQWSEMESRDVRYSDGGGNAPGGLDDDDDARSQGHAGDGGKAGREGPKRPVTEASVSGGMDDSQRVGWGERWDGNYGSNDRQQFDAASGDGRPNALMLGRNPVDWLYCRDGRWRPVGPGTFPLVDAATARVGRLRAYGNALDAETATEFVIAVMESI